MPYQLNSPAGESDRAEFKLPRGWADSYLGEQQVMLNMVRAIPPKGGPR